jgi:hypothetical protein
MSNYTEIQQAFVRHYMDENVIGVRIQKIDNELVLVAQVDDPTRADLPSMFRELPVQVRADRRAVLAYR